MRGKLLGLAAAALLAAIACQKVQPPAFVRYKSDADVPRISIQDAKTELDAGTAVMVDSRPEFAYQHEHVTGSINIPLGTPPEKFKEQLGGAQGKKVFIYCS